MELALKHKGRLKHPAASIVGLIFALGWPLLLPLIPSQVHQDVANARQDFGIIVMEWIAFVILAAIVVLWERLPFARSIGMRQVRWMDAVSVVAGLVSALILVAALFAIAHAAHIEGAASMPGGNLAVGAVPFVLRFVLVSTAAICEETFFRGYAIERLTAFSGNVWIAALAATLLFTLGHIARYGFTLGLLMVFLIGAVLALIYVWRRNLWPCIAAHWIIDGLPLVIAPFFVVAHH